MIRISLSYLYLTVLNQAEIVMTNCFCIIIDNIKQQVKKCAFKVGLPMIKNKHKEVKENVEEEQQVLCRDWQCSLESQMCSYQCYWFLQFQGKKTRLQFVKHVPQVLERREKALMSVTFGYVRASHYQIIHLCSLHHSLSYSQLCINNRQHFWIANCDIICHLICLDHEMQAITV